MICIDKDIKQFIRNENDGGCQDTRIFDAKPEKVQSIGYDLCAQGFYHPGNKMSMECQLEPGESVLVGTEEIVYFAKDMIGRVYLKNSRIRMGLSLEAPLYQPGHKTRIFYRLTNISDNRIVLKGGESYAMLVFERLENAPEKPYEGAFSDEFDYTGLASYSTAYKDQIQSLDGKIQKIEEVEQRMYGNVSVLLTVFIGIFTLLNINVSLVKEAADAANFVLFNAGTLCAISFLMALINEMLQKNDKNKSHWIWWAPVVTAAIAVLGYVILK